MSTRLRIAFLLLAACLLPGNTALAQPKPQPVKPNPLAPVLNMVPNGGLQRGTSAELLLTGTNMADPTTVQVGGALKVTIPTDGGNGKDKTKLKVKVEVPATTPPGFYPFRLATTHGMSNLRLFCIDDLPQVVEVDTNRNKATPQALTVPCVVTGKTDAESSDWYKITVKAGQRLSFEVLGRRLGSGVDPQLTLYHAASSRELAHSNDDPGCQTDPRLNYTFKEAGDYLIEVKDVVNRGAADYLYRLRIGDFPLVTVPLPMALKRGQKAMVRFAGPHASDAAPVEITAPTDRNIAALQVAPRGPSGLHGWPVTLALSDHDELLEMEPNNASGQANRVPVPGGITGRFEKSDDADFFVFAGKKGQKVLIEATTLELGSPTLVYMVVRNDKGAELAKSSPQAAPPADQRVEFTPAADGDVFVEVQHLNYLGGPSEAYHLTITPSVPTFELTTPLDRWDIVPGGTLTIPVTVARKGYTEAIEMAVAASHMGLTGKLTIAAKQNAGNLIVQAAGDLPAGPQTLHLTGKATSAGQSLSVPVEVRNAVSDALGGLPFPPLELQNQIAVAVKERPPFRLTLALDPAESSPGLSTTLLVTAERDPGFTDEIKLDPATGLPPNVKAPAASTIPKGQNSAKITLALNPKATVGVFNLSINGKGKHQGKDFLVGSTPAKLTLGAPFALKVEPAPAKLKQGDKLKLKVTATRKAGYDGPISLELKNLPAGVSAAKATLAKGQGTIELELSAQASAAVATKNDVQVVGVATALNNLQGTAPNLVVEVQKK